MNIFSHIIIQKSMELQLFADYWTDAIMQASSILERTGYVTSHYARSIIANTQKYGVYYAPCDVVLIPHTDEQSCILRTGGSLAVFPSGVYFDEKHTDVRIIIALAIKGAVLNDEHVDQLIDFCQNQNLLHEVVNCSTKEDFVDIMQKYRMLW